MAGDPWQDLRAELDRWADAGRCADFWLRDDDAVAPTPTLDRLLTMTAREAVPLLLAVIPASSGESLAEHLRNAEHVDIGLHGWAHVNHAPSLEKKQEFGPHRPHEIMLQEMDRGRRHLEHLHEQRFVAVFVPPWNRIDWSLAPRLPEVGIDMLSTFGTKKLTGEVLLLNSTVDIIDWRGGQRGRDAGELVAEIVAQLRRSFENGEGAVGVLTHHLVHDDAAWTFLENLFQITAGHRGCAWRSFRALADTKREHAKL